MQQDSGITRHHGCRYQRGAFLLNCAEKDSADVSWSAGCAAKELSPIEHVGNSFIPALFVHGVEDEAWNTHSCVEKAKEHFGTLKLIRISTRGVGF